MGWLFLGFSIGKGKGKVEHRSRGISGIERKLQCGGSYGGTKTSK